MSDTTLLDELLRHKLAMHDRKLEELEAVGEGERKIVSICMAFVKRLEAENAKLTERIDSLTDAMAEQRSDINANTDSVLGLTERMDKSSTWAATLGAWAKEQGMKS